ncbi:MAG: dipeptide ABC transporter ATP-binding protein [Nitrospinae bacterium]|nr:dipeptide ABC transporter ATP-binding protein [Nitrospinota bacterium]MBL7019429.1 dipeptide ABC transporter ATP-binding protein [Nitrospinaceae bacterium]
MLLSVKNLATHFHAGPGKIARAVDGISFDLELGKTLALVGESGCGKTQTAFSIIRLIAENGYHPTGEIQFQGQNLFDLNSEEMRGLRGNDIAMIFQEPMMSLNPLFRIGDQLEEPLQQHLKIAKGDSRKRALELLDRVGIPDPHKRIDDYPHQLSGGMKQRVMIAMALACEPKLLIADEPTTALDVTIQAQVLSLMSDLQKQTGMAILLITHDMGIVNQMADDLCIMYGGRVAEYGSREQIFSNMTHPYTQRLFSSIPKLEKRHTLLDTIPGLVPSATEYGEGCRFADRCAEVMDICHEQESTVHHISSDHLTLCHLLAKGPGLIRKQIGKTDPLPVNKLENTPLVKIRQLKTHFPVRKGVFLRVADHIRAVDNINLDIPKGSTVALVGESGCGKTTLGESILQLVPDARGEVFFGDQNIMSLKGDSLKKFRKHMQIVFQDPFGSLQPRMTIERIVGEGIEVHQPMLSSDERTQKIARALEEVGLSPSVLERYPHEFSGGQRQRIAIARALILEPEFLVLDEPTSALDVSVQAQVLNLLKELQARHKLTYLFISHNLSVVRYMADTVAIMYLGRIVEQAPVEELFKNPRHPYTKSLLESIPTLETRKPFKPLVGDVPSPLKPPTGCHFHPRCPVYLNEEQGSELSKKCTRQYPEKTGGIDSFVSCHHAAQFPKTPE